MIFNRVIQTIHFILAIFFIFGCSTPRILKPRIWDTSDSGSLYPYFPELDDKEYLDSKKYHEFKPDTKMGVAFSGGGTRSAPASIGQLIGLQKTGLIKDTDYFSVVSGGAWAVVPYVYLPKDKDETVFLGGDYISPRALKNCNIFTSILQECTRDYEPRKGESEFSKFTRLCGPLKGNFMPLTESIYCNGRVVGKTFLSWITLQGDETFSNLLSRIFLDPYGLGPERNAAKKPTNRKFFAWKKCPDISTFEESNVICNDDDINKKGDFNLVKRERPFLVASSTLMLDNTNKKRFFHLEMTPLYTGVRVMDDLKYLLDPLVRGNWEKVPEKAAVGGMYIESLGYDSKKPNGQLNNGPNSNPYRVKVTIRKDLEIFSLENMLAATGAAPQETIRHAPFPLNLLTFNFGFPEHYYWTSHGEINGSQEKPHGDGGHMDNHALMPLLARGVQNILVFINEFTPYSYNVVTGKRTIDDNVISYFDLPNKYTTYKKIYAHYPHNVVFKQNMLEKLFENFDAHNEGGKPLLSCHQNVVIIPNKRYGILASDESKKPYRPNICFLYLNSPRKWTEEIEGSKLSPDERPKYEKTTEQNTGFYFLKKNQIKSSKISELVFNKLLSEKLSLKQKRTVKVWATNINNTKFYWMVIKVKKQSIQIAFKHERIGTNPLAIFLCLLFLNIIFSFVTAFLFVRYITRPLTNLINAAKSLGNGIKPTIIQTNNSREIQDLYDQFEKMSTEIQNSIENRNTLLIGISHELRTPITRLTLLIEMASDKIGDTNFNDCKQVLYEMDSIIKQFLSLGRGVSVQAATKINISESIAHIVDSYNNNRINYEPSNFGTLDIPIEAFRRIILNLIDNALKYGNEKPVNVRIEKDNEQLSILIIDQGIGIPEDKVKQILQAFVRLNADAQMNIKGLGLGLAISQLIAKTYGWTIEFISNQNEGTTVKLIIPYEK